MNNIFAKATSLPTVKKNEYTFYLCLAILFIWSVHSKYETHYTLNTHPAGPVRDVISQIIALKIVVITFILLYKNFLSRTTLFFFAAASFIVLGKFVGFYDLTLALQSVKINTLALLFGTNLFSIMLAETGFFNLVCKRLIERFGSYHYALLVILCLITYSLSLFLNNLTTMILVLPLTLTLTNTLRLNAVPFVIAEIIAANLGGASSMIGDFPNILIASEMNIPFHSFIKNMMPLCLVNLGIMLAFFYYKVAFKASTESIKITLPDAEIIHPRALKLCLVTLAFWIVIFMFPIIPAGLMALCTSFVLLLTCGIDRATIIKKIRYQDLLFFLFLFIFVGGVQYSGLLKTVVDGLFFLAGKNSFLQCIFLMWAACLVTTLLNAGPTAALFLPMFLMVGGFHPDTLIFWALSLGVCAGSSGTLNGATAGPVVSTMMAQFNQETKTTDPDDYLTFGGYAKYGLPIMYLHLMTATIYICFIYLRSN
ncbi:MAG: hypothetical protein HQM16_12290 [Deltaproteobacteria bacterium]|nr:hypothetical protein [Deltaproteobacteria bacterium]